MLSKSHHYPRRRHLVDTGDVQMTKQSHKAECDIYTILNQYQRTGIITHVQSARPQYTDLPDPEDYQTSLHVLMEAQEAFAGLPARVRAHFSNDPGEFLAAFNDPAQYDQLREFGLLKPKEAVGDPTATPTPAPIPNPSLTSS